MEAVLLQGYQAGQTAGMNESVDPLQPVCLCVLYHMRNPGSTATGENDAMGVKMRKETSLVRCVRRGISRLIRIQTSAHCGQPTGSFTVPEQPPLC